MAAPELNAPGAVRAHAPADGESPGGRFVVSGPASSVPDLASRYGEGLARLLVAVAERMPKAEVDAVWAFPGVKREGREHGVAVVARQESAGPEDRRTGGPKRLRVYRARYALTVKGQDRGRVEVEVEEIALAPRDTLPSVIEGVRRRADEAGEAELIDLAPWKAEAGGGPQS